MMSEGGIAVGEGLGHRSASPPGRESREDWRGGQGRGEGVGGVEEGKQCRGERGVVGEGKK